MKQEITISNQLNESLSYSFIENIFEDSNLSMEEIYLLGSGQKLVEEINKVLFRD